MQEGIRLSRLVIEEVYDRAFEKVDQIMRKSKPCGWKMTKDGMRCNGQYHNERGCCSSCENWSPKGCTTKNLACRAYICHQAFDHRKHLTKNARKEYWYREYDNLRGILTGISGVLGTYVFEYFYSREQVIDMIIEDEKRRHGR